MKSNFRFFVYFLLLCFSFLLFLHSFISQKSRFTFQNSKCEAIIRNSVLSLRSTAKHVLADITCVFLFKKQSLHEENILKSVYQRSIQGLVKHQLFFQKQLTVNYFRKNLHLEMFERVQNTGLLIFDLRFYLKILLLQLLTLDLA